MSMLCLLCFFGAFIIVKQKKCSRADILFVVLMIVSGSTNLLSLIKGLTVGYAGVVEYKFMSMPMLIYGTVIAYIYILYPVESLRPGWLTLKRAMILFLPILFIIILYIIKIKVLVKTEPVSDSWASFMVESNWLNVFMSLLILIYPIFGVAIMLRFRKSYIEWCENNFASMEKIDIKWLDDYIFASLVISLSAIVVVLSNNIRSVLMHNILFLAFFLYGFYRVLFRENPYAIDNYKNVINDNDALLIEEIQKDTNDYKPLTDYQPDYKAKLEEWMATEKPYLRKDFKLIDVMEILPLNRSYLSRLFNDGYGESFYQFVMRYRLEESKRLLLTRPDLKITNIAELSGFSSISVFGRAFTQNMNCSPTQWREKATTLQSPNSDDYKSEYL